MSVSTDVLGPCCSAEALIRMSSPDMLECSIERVQEGASFPGLESTSDDERVQQGIGSALELQLHGDR